MAADWTLGLNLSFPEYQNHKTVLLGHRWLLSCCLKSSLVPLVFTEAFPISCFLSIAVIFLLEEVTINNLCHYTCCKNGSEKNLKYLELIFGLQLLLPPVYWQWRFLFCTCWTFILLLLIYQDCKGLSGLYWF